MLARLNIAQIANADSCSLAVLYKKASMRLVAHGSRRSARRRADGDRGEAQRGSRLHRSNDFTKVSFTIASKLVSHLRMNCACAPPVLGGPKPPSPAVPGAAHYPRRSISLRLATRGEDTRRNELDKTGIEQSYYNGCTTPDEDNPWYHPIGTRLGWVDIYPEGVGDRQSRKRGDEQHPSYSLPRRRDEDAGRADDHEQISNQEG